MNKNSRFNPNQKNKKVELTILCDPIPYRERCAKETLKRLYIFLREIILWRLGKNRVFRGHSAVTRSLIYGLQKSGISFNYNPLLINRVADSIFVLSGVDTLRQAIEIKASGRIEKIFAGPNIVERSSDFDGLLSSKEIDLVITPSQWVKDYYIEATPEISDRTIVWPAGVDVNYWVPNKNIKKEKNVLFYLKKVNDELKINKYISYLERKGYSISILRYGEYTKDEYLHHLQCSSLMIALSSVESESQCIAFAEAWSSDVPVFVELKSFSNHRGFLIKSSSSPYHSSDNGMFYTDFEDFKKKIKMWDKGNCIFNPREWVLKNLTDEITVKNLLKLIDSYGAAKNNCYSYLK